MASLGHTLAGLKAGRAPMSADARLVEDSGFGANPGNLRMRLYRPDGLDGNAPLVVVLHGCTQTAAGYAGPVGWLDLADRFGFVVVAPEQRRENNPNLCFNWFEPADTRRGGGEAASIAQMIAHAVRTLDVDPGRVFITGLSAGGAMTGVMLATYPELFKGGAVMAGLPFGVASSAVEAFSAMSGQATGSPAVLAATVTKASPHRGPWPTVSVWHGQADAVVRASNGRAVADQWRIVHGAVGPSRTARTPAGREFEIWLSPEGDPVVELHQIPGLGHGAPVGSDGPDGFGSASTFTPDIGLSSSLEIAMGWGLVGPQVMARAAPTTSSDPAPSNDVDEGPITRTINDALRKAGLLK